MLFEVDRSSVGLLYGLGFAGLATLGIVAVKLLLVDMAQVDVIWRILLFMGFGGAFLGLSYLINRDEGD